MDDREIKTLEQVREFVNGTAHMEFAIETKRERYALDREDIRAVPIREPFEKRQRTPA